MRLDNNESMPIQLSACGESGEMPYYVILEGSRKKCDDLMRARRQHESCVWHGLITSQDTIGLGEVRRKEESFTTLQSGHLLYHSEANNGQLGVGFLINKKWKDNITRVSSGSSRVAELILRITDRYQLKIVQVYAPTTTFTTPLIISWKSKHITQL